jgi:hypothetical protein
VAIFDTSATVISQAAREMGLISADVSNPYTSTDANILQLCSLLTAAGKELIREHQWSQSLNIHTFSTVAGTSVYNLPADYIRMVDQTGWNRTNDFPLGGPLTPQTWEYIQARGSTVTFRILFRPRNRKLEFANGTDTPGSQSIAFEYMSSYWVQATGQSAGNKAAPTASTDTILFDSHLMVKALKRAFLREKGFDASVAEADYRRALDSVMRDDSPAPVLSLNGVRSAESLLDGSNLPDTGYGA